MKPIGVLAFIATVVAGMHLAAQVSVDVYPRFAMAPAAAKVTARVEKHADNRLLRVAMDCEHFYAATEIELEGEKAPRTHQLRMIDGIPPGECEVSAVVTLVTGKTQRATPTTFQALGEPRP